MTDKKRTMIRTILSYVYNDDLSELMLEESEYRITYMRPVDGMRGRIKVRHTMIWNFMGDFEIYEHGKSVKPVTFATGRWFKVAAYLRSNFSSTRTVLNITAI